MLLKTVVGEWADCDWSDDGADSAGAKTRQHGYDYDNDDEYNKYM